jgi:tRNA dimethylallyltransferase
LKDIAILGSTASGKTTLSLNLASKFNGVILSLDSLSLYKEIDIASAKPTKKERGDIVHFGIDKLNVNESFNSALFFNLYYEAKKYASELKKNLIIVGGTSFYLKSLCDGLSPMPSISNSIKKKIQNILSNTKGAYALIKQNDPEYSLKITPYDSYRIGKWYEIYLTTELTSTEYFKKYKRKRVIKKISIFEIEIDRKLLREKIKQRTDKMIKDGLINEVFYLDKKYTRAPKAMNSIGIKESLEYLDGKITLDELPKKITNATVGLAKRQRTFNKSQFKEITRGNIKEIEKNIKSYLQNS